MENVETKVLTLTEFLLARIAEDEAVAQDAALTAGRTGFGDERRASGSQWGARYHIVVVRNPEEGVAHREILEGAPLALDVAKHVARHDPARVLAECEAKRRIVERCSAVDFATPSTHLAHGILSELALPYADHPDYRDEWRP